MELRKCGSLVCREEGMQKRQEMTAEEHGDSAAACAVAVTCSANDALSLGGLPKLAEPASRLASLAAARELLMPLSSLLIVGTESFM